MRAFAFISVLIGHKFYAELATVINDPTLHITFRYFFEALFPLTVGGAAGVVVFFLTSGYIITHVLQHESPADFIVKRIFRIYPLYIFAVLAESYMAWQIQGQPFPAVSIMLPRLLLIGDFFDVPNALAGVEWTLRIEILFYVFMALIKASGLFSVQRFLPVFYLIIATILYVMPAFPSAAHWNAGYVNTYALFLFLGSLIYLGQKCRVDTKLCAIVGVLLMIMFLSKIALIQPGWKESNYAILALGIFLCALYFEAALEDGRVLRLISDLTFSVYLFHNWLWQYLEFAVTSVGVAGIAAKIAITGLLFFICYLLHHTVERFGLVAGKSLLRTRGQKYSGLGA